MAKSLSPSKGSAPRGRPRTRIPERKDAAGGDGKTAESRPKSKGRSKSRGRSPTSKTTKGKRKSSASAKRVPSNPRGRSQSKSRKAEPKPRSRSASRKSVSRKSISTAEKVEERQTSELRQRRSAAARDTAKPPKSVSAETEVPKTRSMTADQKAPQAKAAKIVELLSKVVTQVKAFGYRRTFVAAWWMISLPVFVLGLHLLCNRDGCYLRLNFIIPKCFSVYADTEFLKFNIYVVAMQFALSALPVGQVVPGFGYRRTNQFYRCNAGFCLLASVVVFLVGLFYYRVPEFSAMRSHRFQCMSATTIVAFGISALLYVKSFIAHSRTINRGSPCSPGIENNLLHDFVHGREVSPKIGRTLDLGLVILRAGNFIWIVIAIMSLIQAGSARGPFYGWNYSTLMVTSMHMIYIVVKSCHEEQLLKSALIQQGVGFLYVFTALVLMPFCATLPMRYLIEANVPDFPGFVYPAIIMLYLIGMYFMISANTLKLINARAGGKTIRFGPYALIRHPNYLGELLIILSWSIPCGKVLLPYTHLLFVVLLVVCRTIMIEKDTNADYRNYQQQVRYRILPFIF
ncbi:lamin-B receptor-like [Tropilaelaps mercedesae]|uniref:Lamin-B receptor-like n=1 Tax=Tropilaelaps mercedesae TaxID=418985 RepID=A0A1V9XLC1_9ACAR|nr:lamin-B receptor-like [Tropilaelaps mercedesae]